MYLLKKKSNRNLIIGIIILIIIVIILFCYKKINENFSDITSEIITKIDSDIAKCFDIAENENFEILQLNYDFLQKNQTELLEKIKEIMIPGLILMTRYLRLYGLDFMCKNETNPDIILNLFELFIKQIKSLITFHYKLFNILSNNTMQTLNYDNTKLINEIDCIIHSKLSFNENNIIKDFDYIEFPYTNNIENYSITGFTEEIYNLIIKKSKNQETNYCENVNINESKSLIQVYRMHPFGELKQCKTSFYPEKTNSTTPPSTTTGTNAGTTTGTNAGTTTGTNAGTTTGTTTPTMSSYNRYTRYNRYNQPRTFSYEMNDDDPSLSNPFYIPFQPRPTLFPFNTNPPNQNRYNGGSHNFKSYVEFPSYKNINLENDTGHNNFFLPNIMIDE
jgi:hypothetical protein